MRPKAFKISREFTPENIGRDDEQLSHRRHCNFFCYFLPRFNGNFFGNDNNNLNLKKCTNSFSDCKDYVYASEDFLQDITSSECLDTEIITNQFTGRSNPTTVMFQYNNRFDHRNRSVYRFDFDVSLLSSLSTSPPELEFSIDYSSNTELPVLGIGDVATFTVTINIIPLGESESRQVFNKQFGKLNLYNNTMFFTLDPPLEIGPGRVDVTLILDNYQWPENIETTSVSSHLFFMKCLDGPNCGTFRDSWNNLTVEFNHLTCLDWFVWSLSNYMCRNTRRYVGLFS